LFHYLKHPSAKSIKKLLTPAWHSKLQYVPLR